MVIIESTSSKANKCASLQALCVNMLAAGGKKKMADIYTQELEEEQVRLDEVMSDRCAGGSRVR